MLFHGSMCPRCKSTAFESAQEQPNGSASVLTFVRCTGCKTVVGAFPDFNPAPVLGDMVKKLDTITKQLNTCIDLLQRIERREGR